MRKELILMAFIFSLVAIAGAGFCQEANETVNATEESAFYAILNAEEDIQELQDAGFSISYVNDTLIEAKTAFYGENHSDLYSIVNSSISNLERKETALQLLNVSENRTGEKRSNYTKVLNLTGRISRRKERTYQLYDELVLAESNIEREHESGLNISEASEELELARESFEAERLDEAREHLSKIDPILEQERAESSRINILRENSITFVQRNWQEIIIASAVSVFIIIIAYGFWNKRRIKKDLKKMKLEKKTIEKLLKDIQEDRFVDKSMSSAVYNVRSEQYKNRLERLKAKIPVYEKLVKKNKKKLLVFASPEVEEYK